jgi:hypothetical protein
MDSETGVRTESGTSVGMDSGIGVGMSGTGVGMDIARLRVDGGVSCNEGVGMDSENGVRMESETGVGMDSGTSVGMDTGISRELRVDGGDSCNEGAMGSRGLRLGVAGNYNTDSRPIRLRRGQRESGELNGLRGVFRRASDRHNWSHRRTVHDRSGDDDPCDCLEGTHFYGRRVIRPSL